MPPDPPPVRPLPAEQPAGERRHPHAAAWLAAAAGTVGLVVGLLLGLGVGAGGGADPASTTTGVTLSERPPDLATGDFVTTTFVPTTTTEPPPTTTTTRADPAPPPTLAEMVPELDGTLLVAFPGTDAEVWRWRLDDPQPERLPMPSNTGRAGFDSGGGWAAALVFPDSPLRAGAGLYLAGPDLEFRHFDSGVVGFQWHPTVRGRLAWTKSALDGTLELWTGDVPGPAESLRRVAVLGRAGASDPTRLVGFGDWGYAVTAPGADGGPARLVTFDPEGRLLGERTTELIAAAADGTLLVAAPAPGAGPLPDAGITGPRLSEPSPAGWPVTWPTVFSADATRSASVLHAGVGAVLQVNGPVSFQSVLDTPSAQPLAWSPGDRFVVLWAQGVRTRFSAELDDPPQARERRRPALVFFDVEDRSVSAIAIELLPIAVGFATPS